MRQRVPNAEFHIYGDGPEKSKLVHLTERLGLMGSVRFFGFVPLDQVAEVIANSDLGIVPKRANSFGNEAYSTKIMEFMSQGVPVVVSDEYELAELSQIGDAYLSTVETNYYRNAAQNKDELRVEGQLANGTPYTIIHDFKLREVYSAPGSLYGQGYSSQFQGPLGTVFTVAKIRDGNGKLQSYAGASNGQIYQLYTGADDVGNQYTADLILLCNGGTQRPSVAFIDWYGDSLIDVYAGQTLSTSMVSGAEFGFEALTPSDNPAQVVQGSENDFLFRAYFTVPEVQHKYIRFVLSSHSADGNLALNSPPHVPLEAYGRLYELIPAVGDQRDR